MNKEKYNKQNLTDYLLSSMPEADAELFDKLSITDDDFADELKSAENDLIDAYIHRDLENSDLARFEVHYLASPLRREKVEFAKALQVVVEKNVVVKTRSETKASTGFFAFWNIFSNFSTALRLGFAAILLAFVGIFSWFLLSKNNRPIEQVKIETTPTIQSTTTPTKTPISNQTTPIPTVSPKNINAEKTPEPKVSPTNSPTPTVEPTKLPTPNIPTLATVILRPPTRGGNSLQTISIPKQTTDVAFGLPLETDDFKTYSVKLTNQAGKVLWQAAKLTSKTSKLNIRLSAKLLQSNIYSFAVSGISETGETENIGNYSFKFVLE